jgi:hypothetical protein
VPDYIRNRALGGTYVFTVNLHDSHSNLLVTQIHPIRASVASIRQLMPFQIAAWAYSTFHRAAANGQYPSTWTLRDMDDSQKGERPTGKRNATPWSAMRFGITPQPNVLEG